MGFVCSIERRKRLLRLERLWLPVFVFKRNNLYRLFGKRENNNRQVVCWFIEQIWGWLDEKTVPLGEEKSAFFPMATHKFIRRRELSWNWPAAYNKTCCLFSIFFYSCTFQGFGNPGSIKTILSQFNYSFLIWKFLCSVQGEFLEKIWLIFSVFSGTIKKMVWEF